MCGSSNSSLLLSPLELMNPSQWHNKPEITIVQCYIKPLNLLKPLYVTVFSFLCKILGQTIMYHVNPYNFMIIPSKNSFMLCNIFDKISCNTFIPWITHLAH